MKTYYVTLFHIGRFEFYFVIPYNIWPCVTWLHDPYDDTFYFWFFCFAFTWLHEHCPDCGHNLFRNEHGFDQNDFDYNEQRREYYHSGRCTYCSKCNPEIFKEESEAHLIP